MVFQTPLIFVIPDPEAFPSGGNLYNLYLIRALKALGHTVSQLSWSAFQEQGAQHPPGIYFFDTLYLKQVSLDPPNIQAGCSWHLLVHHLESLYPPKTVKADVLFQELELPVLQGMEGFLVSSSYTAGYLRAKGLSQPIATVPPALLIQPKGPVHKANSASPSPVLLVANVVERKGILPLLKELTLQVKPEDAFILQIIGSLDLEAAYVQACLEVVANSSVLKNKVIFSGSLPREALSEYYAQAKLFVSSSFMETYGMALQEAVANKIPILAVQGGNAGNHVEAGINGFVFEDVKRLSKSLLHLLRNPEELSVLRKGAFQYEPYAQYSWETAARNLVNSLNEKDGPLLGGQA